MSQTPLNRRDWLRFAAFGAGATLLPSFGSAQTPATLPTTMPTTQLPATGKPFRVAHLTDTHVQPERGGDQGLIACLRHLHEHNKPDLIIAGGDNVFDAFGQSHERADQLFNVWNKIIADECKVPLISALGNHDIWGWNKKKSKTTGDEPNWGKAWAVANYKMPNRYYSVDNGGWHMILLDSIQPNGNDGYFAQLDDEQFAWLEADLAKVDANTPVLVVSHIPILSMTPLFAGKTDSEPSKGEDLPTWDYGRGSIHTDARRIKELFKKHPNVKLAISGHIHMVDRIDYLGVSYLCNTAVSGSWWKGDVQEFKNGYTILDLYPDGRFDHQTVYYGWVARDA